ncbi:MAG: proline hydroxylase, partial [Aeromicrobium sp.]|nr:proline hydroxylase [Aeromicrobium sp.]
MTPAMAQPAGIARRVAALDWANAVADLDNVGIAAIGPILSPGECHALSDLYDRTELFRSTVDMARHRFGEGQYRYFGRPAPPLVAELRASFWPHLLPIARDWAARLKRPGRWPDDFDAWIAQCHAAGQTRPTPLMLR